MDRLPAEALDSAMQLAAFQIIRRNGAVVAFDPNKIAVAMTKAFLAVEGRQGAARSASSSACPPSSCGARC